MELRSVLRLDGNQFTSAMRRIARVTEQANRATGHFRDANGRLHDSMGRFVREADRSSRSLAGFGRAAGGTLGSVRSLTGGFLGLAGAIGGVVAANKLLKSTVGEAMERELSAITIGAMFDTEKASKAYLEMIRGMALDSPVLNFTQMAGGSKRLLSLTRDTKVLTKAWKNVEKLQAFAPDKSTDDAIRGIAELASGDVVSLKEVFNLDKKALHAIKGLSFDKQVDGLEKLLTKMKITDKFIDKIGNTTFSKLNQVKEKFTEVFANMGGPSLDVLSNFFDNVLKRLNGPDAQRFADIGAGWIKKIISGLTGAAVGIYDWFTSLTNSSEFKSKTTLFSKVEFVISSIYEKFLDYLKNGGNQQIKDTASTLIQILAASIKASAPVLVPMAIDLGVAIGQGIVDGFKKTAAESLLGRVALNNPFVKAAGMGFDLYDKLTNKKEGPKPYSPVTSRISPFPKPPKKNGGLDFVPRDGMEFSLHRGEAILARGTADEYRKGKNGAGNTFNFTVNMSGSGSTRQDAEKLMREMSRLIEGEYGQMRGAL